MELTLSGCMWCAQEAAEWGMVSRVVGKGEGVIVREAIALACGDRGEEPGFCAGAEGGRQRWYVLLVCFLFMRFGLIRACVHGSLFSV
jgi:hypothetical protein